MRKIEIRGFRKSEHTIIINNQVFQDLFDSKKIDAFNVDGDDSDFLAFLKDSSVVAFIGYRAALEGAKYDGVKFPYNETQFRLLMSKVTALQITEYFSEELLLSFNYAAEKMMKSDVTEEAEKKD